MSKIKNIFVSMRPKQWAKNLFIFMPLVFSGTLFVANNIAEAISAFIVFCIASSGVYILNDIQDMKKDSFHPKKKARPIASGALTVRAGRIAALTLLSLTLAVSFFISRSLFSTVTAYIALNLLYSFVLKHEVLIDVMVVALGFELRIWAGSFGIGVEPSIWLQLCVFILAIFLGLLKRRHEKTSLPQETGGNHRGVLNQYKIYLLDQLIMISATLCVVFYGLYAISPDMLSRIGSTNMAYTIPFVIYGIFRYLYVVHIKRLGGEPGEVLASDIPFLLNIVLWLITSASIIYLAK